MKNLKKYKSTTFLGRKVFLAEIIGNTLFIGNRFLHTNKAYEAGPLCISAAAKSAIDAFCTNNNCAVYCDNDDTIYNLN